MGCAHVSAISACCGERSEDKDARTIQTDGGRRCKNSCLTKALSGTGPESPNSCCMCRSSWEGLWSPSSSAVEVVAVVLTLALPSHNSLGALTVDQ